jgi:hypothetical protein
MMNRIFFRSQGLSSPLITCDESHRPVGLPLNRSAIENFKKKLPPLYLGEPEAEIDHKDDDFFYQTSLSDSPRSVLPALSWYQSTV